MRIGNQTLMWGALLCAIAGAIMAWRLREQQIGGLNAQLETTRLDLENAVRRANTLETQARQLEARAQAAVSERQQFQTRAEEARREIATLRERAAKAEAELARLTQIASAKGISLKPSAA